jgi:hypothetical protein
MGTKIDIRDVRNNAEFKRWEESSSLCWIAFASLSILILVSVIFRVPVRDAILCLSLITAVMMMMILRRERIFSLRRLARSRELTEKVATIESIIRSHQPAKSLWISRLLNPLHRLTSRDDGGAKWDVRPIL